MNIDLPALPAGIVTLLGLLAPYAIALINRPSWSVTARKVVSVLVPILLTAVVIGFYFAATGDAIPAWPALVLLAIVTAQASYALVTKPTAQALEAKTSPADVTESEEAPVADPIYTSAAVLAIDAQGKPVAGAEFAAYAPEDTAFTTPLTVSDPVTGAPINPLKAGANGALPAFTVAGNHPRVILKSGSFSTEVVALQQLVADRVAAAGLDTVTVQAAIDAGTTAADAASDAVQAKTDAVAAAGTATTKAAEVAAVVATNDGIMTAVAQDPESAFSAELSATIAVEVGGLVPDAVTSALSDDPTIIDAAEAAVDGVLGSADLVKGTDSRIAANTADPDIAYAVTDESDRASWLAVTQAGGVPAHSAAAIITATGAASLQEDERAGALDIVDELDRMSDFGLKADGTFADRTIAAIAARIQPLARGLTTMGDSMTESGQGGDIKWPQIVADFIGLPLWNPSVSGEASGDIAIRSGATTPLVTVPGNSIPAAVSALTVTISPSTGYRSDTVSGPIGDFLGVLRGVPGTLSHQADNTWTFTRTSAGSAAIDCPAGSPFYTQDGKAHRDDIWIIWAGRNNPDPTTVLRDTAAIVKFLTGNPKKFIVLSLLTAGTETSGSSGYNSVAAVNAALAATYPNNYFDMRRHLIDNGLALAGLSATGQDTTDIAADTVPASLRADNLHPNRYGIRVIADKVTELITAKGWATR